MQATGSLAVGEDGDACLRCHVEAGDVVLMGVGQQHGVKRTFARTAVVSSGARWPLASMTTAF